MSLRDKFLEKKKQKGEKVEILGEEVYMKPVTVRQANEIQNNTNDSDRLDLLLGVISKNTVEEDGSRVFKEEDLEDLLDLSLQDPLFKSLIEAFNSVNDIQVSVDEME